MTKNKEKYTYHVPVLLEECIEGLSIRPDGVYVDVTFGGGGHSRAILEKLSKKGQLYVFDQDKDAEKNGFEADNFHFIASNFSYLKNQLRALGVAQVDGIIADLGVSSHQFNQPERGFSIRADERLDMRMNQRGGISAFEIVNNYEEEELLRIFNSYGEIKKTYKTVQTICSSRTNKVVETTGDLIQLIKHLAPRGKENKFLAQVFQAIRIEVNDELEALKQLLEQSVSVLRPEGRMVVMSYHSLEDRLVKNFFKRGSFDGKIEKDFYGNILKPYTEVNRKPIIPEDEEINRNSRARSAKLRIAERNKTKE